MQDFSSSVDYLLIMEDCIHLTHEIYVYYNYSETLKLVLVNGPEFHFTLYFYINLE